MFIEIYLSLLVCCPPEVEEVAVLLLFPAVQHLVTEPTLVIRPGEQDGDDGGDGDGDCDGDCDGDGDDGDDGDGDLLLPAVQHLVTEPTLIICHDHDDVHNLLFVKRRGVMNISEESSERILKAKRIC